MSKNNFKMTTISPQNSTEDGAVSGNTTGTLSISANSTDGGYDYEVLGSTDSRYECPICLLYLKDPVLTTCGHRFCSGCISVWVIKEGGKCPVDGVNLSHENIFPDNFTRREIMQFKAKCPFVKDGCDVILSLSELERHVQLQHVTQNVSPTSSKLNNGGSPSTSTGIIDCLYKEVGCAGYFPQDQLQRHFETEVHHHLQLLTAAYKRLKVSSRPSFDYTTPHTSQSPEHFLRQDSRESTVWLLGDETIDSDDYQFRRQRSWDSGVRFARTKQPFCRPRYPEQLAESDESLCHKSTEFEPGGKSNGIVSMISHSPLKNSTSVDMKDVFERLVRLEQNDREKQIKIDQLETRLSSAVNLFSTVTRLMDDLTARYCRGMFVWKIPGMKKLCSEMRKNWNRYIHSPGFYTDTFGYKVCLRFNLKHQPSETASGHALDNPLERDDDTFVSLNIHFMQGEYDDTLRWPFCGEVKMSIIHPTTPDNTLMESWHSKPNTEAFAKPKLPRNDKGFGYDKFCSLSEIFSSGFVKDDTLVCKILVRSM